VPFEAELELLRSLADEARDALTLRAVAMIPESAARGGVASDAELMEAFEVQWTRDVTKSQNHQNQKRKKKQKKPSDRHRGTIHPFQTAD
jgi:hypothetical protein